MPAPPLALPGAAQGRASEWQDHLVLQYVGRQGAGGAGGAEPTGELDTAEVGRRGGELVFCDGPGRAGGWCLVM